MVPAPLMKPNPSLSHTFPPKQKDSHTSFITPSNHNLSSLERGNNPPLLPPILAGSYTVAILLAHSAYSNCVGVRVRLTGSGWLFATAPSGPASNNPTFHDEVSARMTDCTSPLFAPMVPENV